MSLFLIWDEILFHFIIWRQLGGDMMCEGGVSISRSSPFPLGDSQNLILRRPLIILHSLRISEALETPTPFLNYLLLCVITQLPTSK